MRVCFYAPVLFCLSTFAQDPVGSLEGEVRDPSGGAVAGAAVAVLNLDTGYKQAQTTSAEGFYKLSLLPVGQSDYDRVSRIRKIPATTGSAQRQQDNAGRCRDGATFVSG